MTNEKCQIMSNDKWKMIRRLSVVIKSLKANRLGLLTSKAKVENSDASSEIHYPGGRGLALGLSS